MIKTIMIVLVAMCWGTASVRSQIHRENIIPRKNIADSLHARFIPIEKTVKNTAWTKSAENESQDIVDVKYEWDYKWGILDEFLYCHHDCYEKQVYADGTEDLITLYSDDISVYLFECSWGGVENPIVSSGDFINVIDESYSYCNDILTETYSQEEVVVNSNYLTSEDAYDWYFNGFEWITTEDNFAGTKECGPYDFKGLSEEVGLNYDRSAVIQFNPTYSMWIYCSSFGNLFMYRQVPDRYLITAPLSEGGLVLSTSNYHPKPEYDYQFTRLPGDSQYLISCKVSAAVKVSHNGMEFKDSCDITFHVTIPTEPEAVERARQAGLMP